jgi:hypothetical protein
MPRMRAARALLWPVSFIKYDTRGPLYTLKIDLSRKNSLDFYAAIHLTLPDKSCEKLLTFQMPPMVSFLRFLSGECTAGTISPAEILCFYVFGYVSHNLTEHFSEKPPSLWFEKGSPL